MMFVKITVWLSLAALCVLGVEVENEDHINYCSLISASWESVTFADCIQRVSTRFEGNLCLLVRGKDKADPSSCVSTHKLRFRFAEFTRRVAELEGWPIPPPVPGPDPEAVLSMALTPCLPASTTTAPPPTTTAPPPTTTAPPPTTTAPPQTTTASSPSSSPSSSSSFSSSPSPSSSSSASVSTVQHETLETMAEFRSELSAMRQQLSSHHEWTVKTASEQAGHLTAAQKLVQQNWNLIISIASTMLTSLIVVGANIFYQKCLRALPTTISTTDGGNCNRHESIPLD